MPSSFHLWKREICVVFTKDSDKITALYVAGQRLGQAGPD